MRAVLFPCLTWMLIASPPTLLWAKTAGSTVFAAASLSDALKDVSAAWEKAGHQKLRLSFASSSLLARQIEQGAPADLFASADQQWMDYLDKAGLIVTTTRTNLLSNQLVLVVPKDRVRLVAMGPDMDLSDLLGMDGRLAVADPAHVPAGIYARQALTKLGLWAKLEARLARAEDVRSALLLVERGEAQAGVVYATDAAASSGVVIAGTFPSESHAPITYPFAITSTGDGKEVRELLGFLSGPEAREIFVRRGFIPIAGEETDDTMLAQRFHDANVSHDGHLTLDQARAARLRMVVQDFEAIDKTQKGYVTLDDIKAWRAMR